tara:strand:- start:72 stop:626 length:555 start_codon:yes stop_codon:yes gene_type:complete
MRHLKANMSLTLRGGIITGLLVITMVTVIGFLGLNKNHKVLSRPHAPRLYLESLHYYDENGYLKEWKNKEKKWVLIHFWDESCSICKKEHTVIQDIQKDLSISIIGMLFQDTINSVRPFLESFGNPYALIGKLESETSIEYGVFQVPATLLVDEHKAIHYRVMGKLSENDVVRIKNIVKKIGDI